MDSPIAMHSVIKSLFIHASLLLAFSLGTFIKQLNHNTLPSGETLIVSFKTSQQAIHKKLYNLKPQSSSQSINTQTTSLQTKSLQNETASTTKTFGVSNGVEMDKKQRYLAELRYLIDSKKRYPTLSKLKKQQGVVTVSFIIYNDGSIQKTKIDKSSGHSELDQSAIKLVESVQGYKPFDFQLDQKEAFISVLLPIEYSL